MPNYVASIGMEVHAELLTESKMFCRCRVAFGGEPNTRVCPVCLGLPGALPVPNRKAIECVIRSALALNCTIAMDSIFHRKNYFYPDLPKGYQISQYGDTNPIGYNGHLEIPAHDGGTKRIRIRRVHLEEDTGKLMHLPGGGSGVDYNRSGVPLMEIVTEFPPDIVNAEEAKEYLVQLRSLLLYLGVCDGKMEHGSLRCEPNISVRPEGSQVYGTKTELKNLNSFRAVQLGSEFEIKRQIDLLESGAKVLQETRGWNEETESSFPMRVKEAENDYRYFPDPDLVAMRFAESELEAFRAQQPELPLAKRTRYVHDFGMSVYDAELLIADQQWAEFFEKTVELGGEPKLVCNWMNSDFAKMLNESGENAATGKVSPYHLVELIRLIEDGTISGKIAKQVFAEVFKTGRKPAEVVESQGLVQVRDEGQLETWCHEALAENESVVSKYKGGQTNTIGFLVGQVMKKSQGKANPPMVQEILRRMLEE